MIQSTSLSESLERGLNDVYTEQFSDTVTKTFFTDSTQTTVHVVVVTFIREAIITSMEVNSQANRTIIAPFLDSLLLMSYTGIPKRKFPLRSTTTFTVALTATTAASANQYIITLNTTSLLVDEKNYSPMDLSDFFLTRAAANAGIGSTPTYLAAATTPNVPTAA